MPAFKEDPANEIRQAIRALAGRARVHIRQDLTVEDVLTLIVRPEHREVVVQAGDLGRRESFLASVAGDIQISVTKTAGAWVPVMPWYCERDAPILVGPEHPARQKLDRIISRWRENAEDFGLALAVFDKLNEISPNPKTLRYFWDGIVPLLKMALLDKTAQAVAELKAPRHIPDTSLALRNAAARTEGIIAKTLLYPPSTRQELHVVAACSNNWRPAATIPWNPGAPLPRV